MRAFWLLPLFLFACGGEPGTEISFQAHAQVTCRTEGLQASLEASGVDGVCILEVNADRTVGGTCFDVPAGEQRAFRLQYYVTLDRDYELAVATEVRDLTNLKRDNLILEFSPDNLVVDRDDDGDGFRNLDEFCCGSHPGIQAETCM